jgi:TonB dependent receptor
LRVETAAFICLAIAAPASAQAPDRIERPPLGSTLTADALRDLPSGGNLFTLLDTVIPEVITDRVDTGGLNTGTASRIGAHGSSWTQPVFRLDGIDVTAPDGSGTPLLLPGVVAWDRVDVATGLMPIDVNAPGLAISLVPRRPTPEWTSEVEGIATGPALLAHTRLTDPPPTARLSSGAYGTAVLSGPLGDKRAGMVLAASLNRSSRYDRADPTLLEATHGSLFTHFVFTPDARDEARVIGWVQRSTRPLETRTVFGQPAARDEDRALHGQFVWERHDAGETGWSAFGSYSLRRQSPDAIRQSSVAIERIVDGPIEALLYPGAGTETAWSAGVRLNPRYSSPNRGADARIGPYEDRTAAEARVENRAGADPHVRPGEHGGGTHRLVEQDAREAPPLPVRFEPVTAGVELAGHDAAMKPAFTGRIGERVNGVPARIWEYSASGIPSEWSDLMLAAYAADRIELHPRVTVDAGLRVERLTGSRAGVRQITWTDLLPRAGLRWELPVPGHVAALAGYSRTAHHLVLTDLAWGDTAAPGGAVYRWNPSSTIFHAPLPAERGALVARIGPGGGAAPVASIDPVLRRPYMDELTFGFEARPRPTAVFRLMGMGRRERDLIAAVNTAVPESAYSVIMLSDPGLFGDGQQLPIYNRPPATFGIDRYQLTNPADHQATFVGAELTGQIDKRPLFMIFGLTAGRSEGLSANRGFSAVENDAALIGELYTNPNARTYAQGRLFTERGYTIKWSGIYRLPHDVRFGWAARYQDGQHFARLVVVPNLNQGPEIVRAFRNGRTRFTFTATLDARLQKGFSIGSNRLAIVLDGYNLLNTQIEIEEFQVGGPLSRTTTAVQPPRALHAGVRMSF